MTVLSVSETSRAPRPWPPAGNTGGAKRTSSGGRRPGATSCRARSRANTSNFEAPGRAKTSAAGRLAHRASARGGASLEGLILVVFFTLALTSVLYFADAARARQQALVTARSCAWRMAVTGCQKVPDDCRGAANVRKPSDGAEGSLKKLRDESAPSSASGEPVVAHGSEGREMSRRSDDAVATEVEGLLFERVKAQGSRSIEQPAHYGGKRVEVGQTMSLPCNSVPKGLGDQIDRFKDIVFPDRD